MFFRMKQNGGFLAWTATAIVTLGVAVGASAVVPQLVSSQEQPPPAASNAQADATVGVPAEVAVATPEPEAAVAIIEETIVPEVETVATTTPRKVAAPQAEVVAPVVVAPAATVPTLPPAPVLAARTVPSAAQLQAATAEISRVTGVPALFISPAYLADGGNQVCTAFDQGQTFDQVKAAAIAKAASVVALSAAAADSAVRTAVAMYCPGYASKLV